MSARNGKWVGVSGLIERLEDRRLFAGTGTDLENEADMGANGGSEAVTGLTLAAAKADARKPAASATVKRIGPTIFVRGTNNADTITATFSSTGISATATFSLNGVTRAVPASRARQIQIDTFDGNDNVTITGFSGSGIVPYVRGGNDNDTLSCNSTASLEGQDGNDSITGSTAIDILKGGNGDDFIRSNGGPDIINHGSGNDNVLYPNGEILLGSFFMKRVGDTLLITGSSGDDSITFSPGSSQTSTVARSGGYTAVVDLSKVKMITLDAKGGNDRVVAPSLVFGVRRLTLKNVESQT